MFLWLALAVVLSVAALSADAAEAPAIACNLSEPETGRVAAVMDGERLQLSDGRIVRLIGAKAPSAPLGWRGDDVEDSKQALHKLASGKEVELKYGGRRTDRYGRALAQVFVTSGGKQVWLQEELVAEGLARVYSFPDNRACVVELRARERGEGESSWRVGLVGLPHPKRGGCEAVRPADPVLPARRGHRRQGGSEHRAAVILTSRDWRSDFTISIERKDVSAFTAAGIDLKGLAGKRLRVRGWVEWRNGPMIAATHREQIELLPDAPASGETKPALPPQGAPGL